MLGHLAWTALVSLLVIYLGHQIYLYLFEKADDGLFALTVTGEGKKIKPKPTVVEGDVSHLSPPPTVLPTQAPVAPPSNDDAQPSGMRAELLSFLEKEKSDVPDGLGATSLDDLPSDSSKGA